jgi:hypothetical protein
MREAPWIAAAKLPPWNANGKAAVEATAPQGAFGFPTSHSAFQPAENRTLNSLAMTLLCSF